MVVESMMRDKLSYKETARQFDIPCDKRVADWERIYLMEGPEGLYIERRGRGSKWVLCIACAACATVDVKGVNAAGCGKPRMLALTSVP